MTYIFRKSLVVLCLIVGFSAAGNAAYLLTEKTHKALSIAQKQIKQGQHSAAEKALRTLLQTTQDNAYDTAVVQQTLGYSYSDRKQYTKAARAFKQALSARALPSSVAHNLRHNVAQLLLADGKYAEGAKYLAAWIKASKSPPNSARVALASAYYQTGNYGQVITHISAAIKRAKAPEEAWRKMLLAAQLKQGAYKSAGNTLVSLITRYPHSKVYWEQLAAVYGRQKVRERALAVQLLAKRLGVKVKQNVQNLANLYAAIGIPYKAAKTLERGIKDKVLAANRRNLQRLADSWIAAKESRKAVATLQRIAAFDSSGKSELQQGQVLARIAAWGEAQGPLLRSLNKLTGSAVGEANLLLGQTFFHQGQRVKAKAYFLKAGSFSRVGVQAKQWVRYIEQQEAREAAKEMEDDSVE